jgi:hypothetical protein
MSATTAGVILGILKEQHADCIVLSDSMRIPLAVGLILEPFLSGTGVTVIYSRDSDGKVVVQNMKCTELARVSELGLRT